MEQKGGKSLQGNNIVKPDSAIGLEITFYTDPLCCWTWAMWPQWKNLLAHLEGVIPVAVKYKMGGLLPSWKHFNDSINSIRNPVQMGPEWMLARVLSGATINDRIWITDPPASSFPACIAVKCVELQSSGLVADFLNLVQDAVMVKGLNIARNDVLLSCATSLKSQYPVFDLQKFEKDLIGEEGANLFRKDLQECKYLNISRMPTFLFRSPGHCTVLLSGYQTYDSLREACSRFVASWQ